MKYTWGVRLKFSEELGRYPRDQQDRILDFIEVYEKHGLADFSKYPGKIAPSWSGLLASHPSYSYTRDNSLWHYHIGIPEYKQRHPTYLTSDYVLHFQWPDKGTHIDLVDTCYHRKSNGEFYLPPPDYLIPAPATPSAVAQEESQS